MTLVLVLCALVLLGGSASGQTRALSFGVPTENELRSGEVHEHTLTASAGDWVSGTLEVRRLAALVEILNSADVIVRADYFFGNDQPGPQRIGFIAPAEGTYRVRIKAFDRFESGLQTAPGAPIPVVGTGRGSYALLMDVKPVAIRMLGVEVPIRERYSSPRLRQLSQQVQEGRGGALDSFWREVAGKGPLVEEIAGNDREVDVTFLWREIYDTRNVLLEWPLALARPDDYYMSRLAGTDVWHKTLRLRHGTRFEYRISPNHRAEDRWVTARLDPLNSRTFPDDPTYRFVRSSVLDMPGAPDEQWALRQPVRRGLIEERKFSSALLRNERDIWVYTPPGYTRTAGPYPFLLLFDGAAYVSNRFGNAPATLDNLVNDGRIRPTIVCFIPSVNRAVEQGFAGADAYGDAIVRELLPMLRASYGITTNVADIVAGGYSAGGLAAALIALRHPEVFGNVLSQSGAFRQRKVGSDEPNSIADLYVKAPRASIRFYLEVGSYDNAPSAALPLDEMILDETNMMGNRHLRDVLRAKGYDVTYREIGGAHEYVHWRAMLADGLMALLAPGPR